MAFECLIDGATWIFIIMIPLALLVVIWSDTESPRHTPAPDSNVMHLRGGASDSSASEPPSRSSSPGLERRPNQRTSQVPTVPPAQPPRTSTQPLQARNLDAPSSRRTRAINMHIDRLMAQRDSQPTFDDNSDFDFHPGDEEEYWSDEEEGELPFDPSTQQSCRAHYDFSHGQRQRHQGSQDMFPPSQNRYLLGGLPSTRERTVAAAAGDDDGHQRRPITTPVSHNSAIMKEVLEQLDQEAAAKSPAKAVPRAAAQEAGAAEMKARQKHPLPLRPASSPIEKRARPETPNPGTSSDDQADSKFLTRGQKTTSDRSSSSVSHKSNALTPGNSPFPNSPEACEPGSCLTGQQASINSHIDAMMRQQGIQQTNWAHVDMPFERSAGEHHSQLHSVGHYQDDDGNDYSEDSGEAGRDSGAEAGETYSYQRASQNRTIGRGVIISTIPTPPFTPSVFPTPQPSSHNEETHPHRPASCYLAAASVYHSTIEERGASELAASETEARNGMRNEDDAPVWTGPTKPPPEEFDKLETFLIPASVGSTSKHHEAASIEPGWARAHEMSEREARRGLSLRDGPIWSPPVCADRKMDDASADAGKDKGRASSPEHGEMAQYLCAVERKPRQQHLIQTPDPSLSQGSAGVASIDVHTSTDTKGSPRAEQHPERGVEEGESGPSSGSNLAPISGSEPTQSTTILPYTHRYDAERSLLAPSSVMSASAPACASVASKTILQPHPQPGEQVPFPQSSPLKGHPPSKATPASPSIPQPLCAEDPVFGIEALDSLSPSVRRQMEIRAGGVLSVPDEPDLGREQDWSDDEYRYGDVAGEGDWDWDEMPSER